ncbi:SDR family NAD(P)-dependent oxidoreductase [Ruegeria arenilitoris]|uniref:SDR family NAD(P)-dependent oxidoreductase n=1 Tax=Ruegeria arenilitoris TaxID=1173585 RepID=UPI00147A124A|nr:SDR family oxidoreductase [Ruegeria arenilitoris]
MDIAGSVALVSGGSGGLGSRICHLLAGNGVKVIVGYQSGADRAHSVCQSIIDQDHAAKAVKIDHCDPVSVSECIDDVVGTFGSLDILVNNAGMASGGYSLPKGDLETFTPEIWTEMLNVNLSGPYYLTRAAAPFLRASKWGRVINLSSTIGHGVWGAAAAYAPSKAAVVPLTRFLAAALAPEVTVNCISPGLMEGTQMSTGAPDEFVALWRDRSILGATTSIDDVAQQVFTFCKSPSVTGQTVVIDGGIHLD